MGNRLMREQDGNVVTWWVIVLAIPLLLTIIGGLTVSQVRGTSKWLQSGLNRSAKAAAWQVTPESYAEANPQIDPIAAEAEFRRSIAFNFGLDRDTLSPMAWNKRIRDSVTYEVRVYNGPFPQSVTAEEFGLDTVLVAPSVVATIRAEVPLLVSNRVATIRRVAIARVYENETPASAPASP